MTVLILKNTQKRRTLFWPIGNRVMPVAAGESFAITTDELDAVEGLRAALTALVEIKWIEIAEGLEPVRH